MSMCDNCGNFDDSHFEDLKETYQDIPKDAHQPDLYYYWDAPLEERYEWREHFPLVDCMCEICFDIANSEGKIIWNHASS